MRAASPGLADLLAIRSRLVEELLDYLRGLAASTSHLPAYYPEHLRRGDPTRGRTGFESIRQKLLVVEDPSAFLKQLEAIVARYRDLGLPLPAYRPVHGLPEQAASIGLEASMGSTGPAVWWDEQATNRFPRAILLGDPGSGKTWILKYETSRRIQTSFELLESRRRGPEDLVIPIFARLIKVKDSRKPLEDSLIDLARGRRSPRFRRFLRERLETGRCLVLLDGLDEVPNEPTGKGEEVRYLPGFRQLLESRLQAFSKKFPEIGILVTCRIIGYEPSEDEALVFGAKELVLQAFEPEEVERFVSIWFASGWNPLQTFRETVLKHDALSDLARIPQMLALICRHWKHIEGSAPGTKRDLMERCIFGFLEESRKRRGVRGTSEADVKDLLHLIQDVAFDLFAEGREQFRRLLLHDKLIKALNVHGPEATKIIKTLVRDGFFTLVGEGELLFLHRTFQEFLAAESLWKRGDRRVWIRRVAGDARWHNVLALTKPIGPYVSELIGILAAERPYLAAKLVLDGKWKLEEPVSRTLLDTLGSEFGLGEERRREAVVSAVERLEVQGGRSLIAAALRDPSRKVRLRASEALRSLKGAELFEPASKTYVTQGWDAKLLRNLGAVFLSLDPERAISFLLQMLREGTVMQRSFAARSLIPGQQEHLDRVRGDERVVQELLRASRDRSRYVRWQAIHALGRLGVQSARSELQKMLVDRDLHLLVQIELVRVLCHLGVEEARSILRSWSIEVVGCRGLVARRTLAALGEIVQSTTGEHLGRDGLEDCLEPSPEGKSQASTRSARVLPPAGGTQRYWISEGWVEVTDVAPVGSEKKCVFLMEQVAVNDWGADLNAAAILEWLIRRFGVSVVFVEGGSRDADLLGLRDQAPPRRRLEVALRHLQDYQVAPEEFLQLATDYDFNLWGVDDPALYDKAAEYVESGSREQLFEEERARVMSRAVLAAMTDRRISVAAAITFQTVAPHLARDLRKQGAWVQRLVPKGMWWRKNLPWWDVVVDRSRTDLLTPLLGEEPCAGARRPVIPASCSVLPAPVPDADRLLARALPQSLYLGTSSWCVPGWKGIVYDGATSEDVLLKEGLQAFAQNPLLRSVELTETYSRIPSPSADLFKSYASQVPETFRFVVHAHELMTSSRVPAAERYGSAMGKENEYFLDPSTGGLFLGDLLMGLGDRAGILLLRFPSVQGENLIEPERFIERLHKFLSTLPTGVVPAVEIADSRVFSGDYLDAITDAEAIHCVSVNPAMPPLEAQLEAVAGRGPAVLVRWARGGRTETDPPSRRYAPFDRLVEEDLDARRKIAALCRREAPSNRPVFVIADNTAEGSAPLTLLALAREIVAPSSAE